MTGVNPTVAFVGDALQRESLLASLTAEGYLIRRVTAGEQLIRLIAEQPVDVMVIALDAVGIDGVALIELLKQAPATAGIPIVTLCGSNCDDVRLRALQAGADAALCDPIQREELSARLRNAVRLKNMQREAEAELRSKDEQLRQAQKMEALGNLAGGVAHDFNNLLTVIISFASFLRDDLGENDPRRDDVAEILRAANSATSLTGQLLAFSRRRPIEPLMLDLDAQIGKVSKLLRRTLGEHIELVILPSQSELLISFDPGQLDQLVFNMAVNARDAMRDGGTLSISTWHEHVAGKDSLEEGDYAVLTISDTGSGMDHDTLARVFEPFFTTKGESGTGLGLATCFGIVRQAGGDIVVTSRVGKGTAVKVFIPLASEDTPQRHLARRSNRPGARSGRLLVVEDQPAILRLIARALSQAGFEVFQAPTAEAAQSLVRSWQGPLDLLVSDVVLPGMSGRGLTRWLREREPELPVVLVSGYMGEDDGANVDADASTAFLAKPFSAAELLARVDQVLDFARASRRGGDILVVEDNPRDAANTRRVLERLGLHSIVCAGDAEEALRRLLPASGDASSPLPQLVLLDLELPNIDGWEVLRRLRADARTAALPTVLVSGLALDTEETAARQRANTAFIAKPLTADKLQGVLTELGMSLAHASGV